MYSFCPWLFTGLKKPSKAAHMKIYCRIFIRLDDYKNTGIKYTGNLFEQKLCLSTYPVQLFKQKN
jgi:hypothetical protein